MIGEFSNCHALVQCISSAKFCYGNYASTSLDSAWVRDQIVDKIPQGLEFITCSLIINGFDICYMLSLVVEI